MKCYKRKSSMKSPFMASSTALFRVWRPRAYTVGEKVITHRARGFGHSKYGFNRCIKGFLDLLSVKFVTGYGKRPFHLFGTPG